MPPAGARGAPGAAPALVVLPLDVRDGEEHEREDGDHRDEEEQGLDRRLPSVQLHVGLHVRAPAGGEEEVGHRLEEVGGGVGVGPRHHPLRDDDEAHVPEGAAQEDDLGDEAEPDVLVVVEVPVVRVREAQAEHHLPHAADDCILLLAIGGGAGGTSHAVSKAMP
eukprot:gene8490-biopygen11007